MMMDPLLIGCLLALAGWLYLALAHHGFWRADQKLTKSSPEPDRWPDIAALIPARNEAGNIGRTLKALAQQNYPGRFRIIVIDDSSDDATRAEAESAAKELPVPVSVITAPPPESGWTGKLWALQTGLDRLTGIQPDAEFLFFTDADIVHGSEVLRNLAAKAWSGDYDLVSLMARLRNRGIWARLCVPPFVFFFQMLYPFPAINRGKGQHAGAAGGCMLIRKSAFEKAGGLKAIRHSIIDDCTLARHIRRTGGRLWLGLADDTRSLRDYARLGEMRGMIARGAFAQLRFSGWLLVLTVLLMAIAFLLPVFVLLAAPVHQNAALVSLAALSWLIMAALYWPTVREFEQSPAWTLTLPLAALLYMIFTIDSAMRHWRGRGQQWKGRTYRHG